MYIVYNIPDLFFDLKEMGMSFWIPLDTYTI